uniref:Spermatogenesis associated 4 n=1 Tax=Neolamprologus brichardi TaxID=32507 RepID=A0A3Q4H9H9_NEOBR
ERIIINKNKYNTNTNALKVKSPLAFPAAHRVCYKKACDFSYRGNNALKTGLPREVVKWLQTLDLAFYPLNVRRDFSSGYLVAQIFSHYYPRDFSLHSYDRGTSLSAKQWNWSQIERKRNLYLKKEAIDGTIHCKPGAAELLVLEVYTILSKGSSQSDPDFTDEEYQNLLPSLARSTASKAIKNNLTATEIKAVPDISTNQRKAENILRSTPASPDSFDGKKSVGDVKSNFNSQQSICIWRSHTSNSKLHRVSSKV